MFVSAIRYLLRRSSASQPAKRKVYSYQKVRTSLKDRTLDSMFQVAHPSQRPSVGETQDGSAPPAPSQVPVPKVKEIKESQCFLKSIKTLRAAVAKARHNRTSLCFSYQL